MLKIFLLIFALGTSLIGGWPRLVFDLRGSTPTMGAPDELPLLVWECPLHATLYFPQTSAQSLLPKPNRLLAFLLPSLGK